MTGAASVATQIRAAPATGGGRIDMPTTLDIAVRVTSTDGVANATGHFTFGPSTVGDPTDTDFAVTANDGWVEMSIPSNYTHFKVKGHAALGGRAYVWIQGIPQS